MNKTRNPDALIRIGDIINMLCREKCYPGPLCPDNYCAEMWDKFEDVERVNAVPVKHGRWIYHPDWQADGECGYECSECGMGSDVDYQFCMRCGARMDGKEGERQWLK